MKKMIAFLALAIVGCDAITGKEVGRIKIDQISTDGNLAVQETTLNLMKDDEVGIWSDMNFEYEGNVSLQFKVEVLKNGEQFMQFEIDPMKKSITMNGTEISVMGKTKLSFLGKNSEMKIAEDGNYTFRAILVTSDNPTLKVNKAEIVFKK